MKILDISYLDPYSKVILVAVANSENASVSNIQLLAGCSYKKAFDTLKMLCCEGYLIESKGGGKNHYTFKDTQLHKKLSKTVYRVILELKSIKALEKLTLFILSHGDSFSYNQIAKKIGCCKRSAIEIINRLVHKNLLIKIVRKVTSKFNAVNSYRINFDYKEEKESGAENAQGSEYEGSEFNTKGEADSYVPDSQYISEGYIECILNRVVNTLDKAIQNTFKNILEIFTTVVKDQSILQSHQQYSSKDKGEGDTELESSQAQKEKLMSEEHQLGEVMNRIKGYGYFDEENAILDAIQTLFYSTEMLNHPTPIIRKNMERINDEVIDHALFKFKEQSGIQRIKNTNKYLATCLYQAIFEQSTKQVYINSKINYEFGANNKREADV